jgi:hypothetical protein
LSAIDHLSRRALAPTPVLDSKSVDLMKQQIQRLAALDFKKLAVRNIGGVTAETVFEQDGEEVRLQAYLISANEEGVKPAVMLVTSGQNGDSFFIRDEVPVLLARIPHQALKIVTDGLISRVESLRQPTKSRKAATATFDDT